jgi:Xaa-Pro aminopeptidase
MARYTAFDHEEYLERMARARRVMREAKLGCCMCIAPENLFYLSGYDSWTSAVNPQALVFSAGDDEPTLLVRNYDLALVRESTWVKDIRTFHLNRDRPEALLVEIARRKGLQRGRVGVDLNTPAVNGAFALKLVESLQSSEIVDATYLLGDLRLIKSPREIAYLREAASYASAGLETVYRALKPGRTEIAVAAEVEEAVRSAGSDYCAIPTEFTAGSRSAAGHGTPRPRVIENGDLAHFEFAGVASRYHATAIVTLSAGDPGSRAKDLYRINLEALRAGIAAVRPGASAAAIEEAALAPLRREGLEDSFQVRFGYGIGIAYPPIWLETLEIDRQSKQVLRPGMVFVLHSSIVFPDEGLGYVQGGTYLLTDGGLEMLVGAGAKELVMV